MDINKNSYTVVFASIMVIIVAAALAYAAIGLKPFQDSNIVLEKKQNILTSVGITIDRENAAAKYSEYIKSEIVLNNKGEEVEGSAFDIDLSKEMKKDVNTQLLPLFISQIDGATSYIIPLRGKGLWGPIWGFIALKDDLTTVYGAVFDHKGETPGLGAEINQPFFQEPFAGKTIFEGLNFTSIKVVKVGYSKGDMHAVDGISGGTITSDGVTDMLSERLSMYLAYFEKIKAKSEVEQVMVQINSLAVINN
ncbi:MAG: NADH:ubiquinone reductase (Na(+)-transporting) subunit C [Bacteroidetes bacterium]|jgi:Na+-transporting NADH:ubiquinone oxidoreductase subunit C|nr:NADH:ubiquinone reductase (Na(+)-transporting) subunit C [Bacteroidota bacterium]